MRHGFHPRRTPAPGPRIDPRTPHVVHMRQQDGVMLISREAMDALKKQCAPYADAGPTGTLAGTFGWTRIEVVSSLPYTIMENARQRRRRQWLTAELLRMRERRDELFIQSLREKAEKVGRFMRRSTASA